MTEKEFKELKVGDKVRIISTPVSETLAGVPSMDEWSGKIMTIRGMRIAGAILYVKMEEDNGDYCWFPEMIAEKVSDATRKIEPNTAYRTLTREDYDDLMKEAERQGYKWASGSNPAKYNGFKYESKTVIKLSDGRVGVAFCSPEDTFDEYEGVRLATARAYGKEPPAKKSKVKEVNRRAKVGEYIKIVNKPAFCVSYENGEIFKVECITPLGSAVVDLGNSFHMPMHEEEYVVLEGYKPKK